MDQSDEPPLERLRAAILVVLRDCLNPTTVEKRLDDLRLAPSIDDALERALTPSQAVVRELDRAIGKLPRPERQAVRIMAGLDRRFPQTVTRTRQDRLNAMAPYLSPGRDADAALGSRRVEQLERDYLIPMITERLLGGDHELDVRRRPVFGHFVNPQVGLLFKVDAEISPAEKFRRLEWATRIAILVSESGLVFPASYVFEVPGFLAYLRANPELVDLGLLRLTGPTPNLLDYQGIKEYEYRDASRNPYAGDFDLRVPDRVQWQARRGTTAGQSIARYWGEAIRPGYDLWSVVSELTSGLDGKTRGRVERTIRDVPDRLEGRAFIADYVFSALGRGLSPAARHSVAWSLSAQYIDSYLQNLDASILVDFPWATLDITAEFDWRRVSVRRVRTWLRHLGLEILLHEDVRLEDLIKISNSLVFDVAFEALFTHGTFDRWMAVSEIDRSPIANSSSLVTRSLDRLSRVMEKLDQSGIVA